MALRRQKLYRHSSTFYRKVKSQLNKSETVAQYFGNSKVLTGGKINNEVKNKETIELTYVEDDSNINKYLNKTDNVYVCNENCCASPCNENCEDFDHEESDLITQITLSEEISRWSLLHRVSHSAIDDLLRLLNTHGIKLPRDSRVLLKTPRSLEIVSMGNGQFWYNGIKNCILLTFSKICTPLSLSLIFNVDGLPPFRSSCVEFWPILLKIKEMPHLQPMVVAIYCGETKPPLQDFFSRFVEELNDILKNGIISNGHIIEVQVDYFVCDTPARSFIKGTVGFNAAHGCLKCTTIGEYDKKGRHMSYPNINCQLRTDHSFRQKFDMDHHKEDSPLLKLPIDMVEDIVIADSLHLFDLGVMRKCLYGWINGSYNFRTKLSGHQINQMSEILEDCQKQKPVEIHRKIRNLKSLKFWKGLEYRTFLLYLGPVVLKPFLSTDAYYNYLTLFCAVTILSCKSYLLHIHVAEQLLKDYIEQFKNIYGIDSISSNIHNLCHVTQDVKKFGVLSEINAYPFENYLGHLKSLLRTGNRPLPQIAKRVVEMSKFNSHYKLKPINSYVKNEDKFEVHPLSYCNKVFNTVCFSNDYILTSDNKNKWFMTKSNDIVAMINATYYQENINIYGTPIKTKHDFFDLPIKSSYLNIYKSDGKVNTAKLYPLNEIKCKLFALKFNSELVFLPLLHTM